MTKTLLIFLFSDRIDPYVNVIAHTFDKMQVDAVKLIHIKDTKTGLSEKQASWVYNNIWNLIEALSEDYYIDYSNYTKLESQGGTTSRQELKQKNNLDIYKRINERLTEQSLVRLDYSELKEGLSQIIKNVGGSKFCLLDLTSATKVPSIDIFSVCLALGVKSVYTFELVDRPDPKNPEASLYHSLNENNFSYTCISDTTAVKSSRSALLRKSPLLWYVGIVALIVMLISLYLLVTAGPQSLAVQGLNLGAAIIGIVTPVFALLEQRRKD